MAEQMTFMGLVVDVASDPQTNLRQQADATLFEGDSVALGGYHMRGGRSPYPCPISPRD